VESLGQEIISSPKTIQTSSRAHPTSYLMGAGVLSEDVELGPDVDH